MIKIFRTIRQRMLNENRFSRYFLYAIGEIVLVVIGIFLALQLNNWNSDRIAQRTMHSYYERMHFEIGSEIKAIESFMINQEDLRSMNKRTLMILGSKDQDSIPALKGTLGALGTAWTVTVKFPVTEEFIDRGYLLKVESDSLKWAFQDFAHVMERISTMNEYTLSQYNDRIEPFINKNLNYSEIALPVYQRYLVQGGPPTDFVSLFSDLELWNVVTLKLEGLSMDIRANRNEIARLKNLNAQILKELERTDPEGQ